MVEPVRTRREFSTLSSSRNRGRSGPLWVVRADAPRDDHAVETGAIQVAFAIGKPVGSAVVRNRLRRRLRAAMADFERAGELAPGLYLVGVRPEGATLRFATLTEHLSTACARLAPVAA